MSNIHKSFRLFACVAVCQFALLLHPGRGHAANLKVVQGGLDKTEAAQGEYVTISYQIRPEGILHQTFKVGILVQRGDQSRCPSIYEISEPLPRTLNQDNNFPVTNVVRILIPDWGLGTYHISVQVDPDNDIHESNENDNKLGKAIAVVQSPQASKIPDLTISAVRVFAERPRARVAFALNVYVGNIGNASSGEYDVAIFIRDLSHGYTYLVGTFRQVPMRPGENYSVYSTTDSPVNELGSTGYMSRSSRFCLKMAMSATMSL